MMEKTIRTCTCNLCRWCTHYFGQRVPIRRRLYTAMVVGNSVMIDQFHQYLNSEYFTQYRYLDSEYHIQYRYLDSEYRIQYRYLDSEYLIQYRHLDSEKLAHLSKIADTACISDILAARNLLKNHDL